jgi:uncharacterized protein YbjT (DUF2867 family)
MKPKGSILLTGASGMTGSLVLGHCLDDPEIERVVSLVRRPSRSPLPAKVKEVIVPDFSDLTGLEPYFEGVVAAYFCLGAYTGQVPDKQFREITVDYTDAFARALHRGSPGARLCFLSGQGADQTGKSRVAFARYKGMAENRILATLDEVYIFRPAYIYPVAKRKEPNLGYRLMRALYPFIRLLGKRYSLPSTSLARAIYLTGKQGTDVRILENADILKRAV